MIRKDFIESEIEKLNQVIAKILRLKNEGELDMALEVSNETLNDYFETEKSQLVQLSIKDYKSLLKSKNYSSAKLDLLGQLLFESVYPFEEMPETFDILHKVLLVFNLLEEEHHQQSITNISRREMINHFLNTRQYE